MKRTTRTMPTMRSMGALDRELMRLLHGELPPAEAAPLRERLAREPGLAEAYQRLEAAWGALDLPPSPGVPPGFARRVAWRAARLPRPNSLSWGAAPAWVRAAAAACLIAGAAAGAGLGVRWSERGTAESAAELFGGAEVDGTESLAESYWGEVAGSSLADAETPSAEDEGGIGESGEGGPLDGSQGPGGAGEGSPL
jgi:hypothetical protein